MTAPLRLLPLLLLPGLAAAAGIDRHALVSRHNVVVTNLDERLVLQVGNGEFAFGVDATGLQTFHGNTMSHWGWHTTPPASGVDPNALRLTPWDFRGRTIGYATGPDGQKEVYNWLRENPHRFNLGRMALRLDGGAVTTNQITDIRQELDLWHGVVTSRYRLDGHAVTVETAALASPDGVAVRIRSELPPGRRLGVELAFPYGNPGTSGADWDHPDRHTTTRSQTREGGAEFNRRLDADEYAVALRWSDDVELRETGAHAFLLEPRNGARELTFVCGFAPGADAPAPPEPAAGFAGGAAHWEAFWRSGGAVDLSGSRDPRARELERRIVLSQYLMAVNASGSLPPQESGLFNNGWNGKFHLEMHWWHGVHHALWGRWDRFDRSLGWYARILPSARERAATQGFRGARWPKMCGPEGRDSPSGVGPLLLWQQPHPIYYAGLDHRLHPSRATLEKWREVVFETAEFMASSATRDPASGRFVLGPAIKTVPENNDARTTLNPAFELSYWRFGLRVAQEWRGRLGLPPEPRWEECSGTSRRFRRREGAICCGTDCPTPSRAGTGTPFAHRPGRHAARRRG
ncbi:MAG: glycoside hydrolase family 65 [Kiritimatiellia bacterium]